MDQLVGQPMGHDRVWVLLHPHAVGFLLKKCNSDWGHGMPKS